MPNTRVKHIDSTQSTNADAMNLAREGERGPLWIVAREQVVGRGRNGRAWHSPPGNLYASLLLTAPCTADVAPQLGFVAGVALIAAVDALLPGDTKSVKLKWPNDVLCDGAKFAGILLEGTFLLDGIFACVAGFGVNCASHPSGLPYAATHLAAVSGTDVTPETLLGALDDAMTHCLARWNKGSDFAAVRKDWLARAAGLGRPIKAALHDQTIAGTFETIDMQGRLVMATDQGPVTVGAGDVHLVNAYPTDGA